MKKFLLAFILLGMSVTGCSQSINSEYSPTGTAPAYGFVAQVDRFSAGNAKDDTVLTVGAQINAINRHGVNQIVFGIATEAWAEQGSLARLVGLEATVINREPENWVRKISMWSTFKNRPDTEYFNPTPDPSNIGSQALRIESQPQTGFERGIVFAEQSLYKSRNLSRPVAIDLSEIPDDQIGQIDLIKIRKNISLRFDPNTQTLVLHKE